MNYLQAKTMYETGRKRKLANNTYLSKTDDYYAITLHGTELIKFYPDKTILSSGGWRTATTKDRLNAFSGFNIWQDKGIWYIGSRVKEGDALQGGAIVFADGITYQNGQWLNTGPAPEKTQKLRKQIKQYAKDFVAALFAGKVPKPSNGDCWYCVMVVSEPKKDKGKTLGEAIKDRSHIIGHIKEKYYVPSLLVRACKTFGISQMAWNCIAVAFGEHPEHKNILTDTLAKVMKQQIENAVRRYCYRQLDTAA